MADFGELGTVHEPEPEPENPDEPSTFTWFGQTVTIRSKVSDVELIDFMANSREIDSQGMQALAAVKDGLAMLIDPADFPTFWRAAKLNDQTVDDLMAVFRVLVEAETGRPTQRPSASSPGPQRTAVNSAAGSASPASPGRPDLQLLHDDAAESRRRVEEVARTVALG